MPSIYLACCVSCLCLFNDENKTSLEMSESEKFLLFVCFEFNGGIIEALSSPNYHKIASEWQIMREGASQ